MAPGAYHLVLRNLPVAAASAGLPSAERGLRLPVQLLLRGGGTAACQAEARHADPALGGGGRRLPRPCRCGDGAAAGGCPGRGARAHRARPAARGAAPGTAADRYLARPGAEPAAAAL